MISEPPGSNISIKFLERFSERIALVQFKINKTTKKYNLIFVVPADITKPLITLCHAAHFYGRSLCGLKRKEKEQNQGLHYIF